MRYFDHDTSAADDDKIMQLRLECGGAAVDAYWFALERIYREETPLVAFGNQLATKELSHRLCVFDDGAETVERWFSTMLEIGLLERDAENPDAVMSPRAKANIEAYVERKETARRNGRKGGRKPARKPKANRTPTEGAKDGNRTLAEPLAKEKEIVLVTHKGLPNTNAPCDAAAAEAAPPAAKRPLCPLCGVPLWRDTQTGRLHCDECGDAFEGAKARWR